MGIYGSLPKVDVNQFVFDKVYPNRFTMEKAAAEDGVFPGRYVRIEYDLEDGYSENQKTDLDEYKDVNANGGRDYDSTVWQKYIDNDGNHKYVMVAELQPTTYVIDWLKYDGVARNDSTKDELYGPGTGGTYLVNNWLDDDGTTLVNNWLTSTGNDKVQNWLDDQEATIDAMNEATDAANTAAKQAASGAEQLNEALLKVETAETTAMEAAENAEAAAKTANEAADKIEGVLEGVNITFKTDSGSATSTSFTVSDDNIIQVSAPESNKLSFAHATSSVTPGTYYTDDKIPIITVDNQGHITKVEEKSISIPSATTVNGYSGNITIEGDGGPIGVATVDTSNIIKFTWPTNLILQCTL